MKLFADLFSTDYGLMSIAAIAVTFGMGVWYVRYFLRRMDEDARSARR
jgi:uncharacterized membrane-anchored protein